VSAAATKALYAAFASYGRRAMEACPHCVNDADQRTIASAPLTSLGDKELGHYAFKAMTTWGEPDDYKHFLPRILELTFAGGGAEPGLAPWLVANKLVYGGWREWPAVERAAVTTFWLAQWTALLATAPDEARFFVEQLLDPITTLCDPAPFLAAWDEETNAALHLARYFYDHATDARLAAPIAAWLHDRARQHTLEAAFLRTGAQAFADAIDMWDCVHP
jgi:hypothetical protein